MSRRTDSVDRRYPMDVGQDGMAPHVMRLNVANLYDYLTGAGIHAEGTKIVPIVPGLPKVQT